MKENIPLPLSKPESEHNFSETVREYAERINTVLDGEGGEGLKQQIDMLTEFEKMVETEANSVAGQYPGNGAVSSQANMIADMHKSILKLCTVCFREGGMENLSDIIELNQHDSRYAQYIADAVSEILPKIQELHESNDILQICKSLFALKVKPELFSVTY